MKQTFGTTCHGAVSDLLHTETRKKGQKRSKGDSCSLSDVWVLKRQLSEASRLEDAAVKSASIECTWYLTEIEYWVIFKGKALEIATVLTGRE